MILFDQHRNKEQENKVAQSRKIILRLFNVNLGRSFPLDF